MANVELLKLEKNTGPEIELRGLETKVDAKTALTPEELLKRVEELGSGLREVIVRAKKLPRDQGFESYQDPTRSLALAQAHLQTGFLWLRRAIRMPKEF